MMWGWDRVGTRNEEILDSSCYYFHEIYWSRKEGKREEGGRERQKNKDREKKQFSKIIIFCSFSLQFTSTSGIVKNKPIVTNAKVWSWTSKLNLLKNYYLSETTTTKAINRTHLSYKNRISPEKILQNYWGIV